MHLSSATQMEDREEGGMMTSHLASCILLLFMHPSAVAIMGKSSSAVLSQALQQRKAVDSRSLNTLFADKAMAAGRQHQSMLDAALRWYIINYS